MSNPKEPGFLAFGEAGYVFLDGYGKPSPAAAYVPRTERDYLALFAAAGPGHRVIGEASTWYLAEAGAAQKIAQFSPQAKIIISLRNPAERAYSAWCHARGRGQEPCESFSEALDCEAQRAEPEHMLRYHRMGMYSEDVQRYLDWFGDARVLLLLYEDISNDAPGTWRRVCDFLQINEHPPPNFDNRYNASGVPRIPVLHKLVKSQGVRRIASRLLPHGLGVRIKNRIEDVNLVQFPPLDDACRARLVAYYREDIRALQGIIDRDLGAWLS